MAGAVTGDNPVSYQIISGQTLEIVYRDVPRIEEAEVLGIR